MQIVTSQNFTQLAHIVFQYFMICSNKETKMDLRLKEIEMERRLKEIEMDQI